MKKLMSKLISRFIYSQPLISLVILMGGIIALILAATILPQNMEIPTLHLVIAVVIIYLVLTYKGKYQYFSVVPDIFIRKRYCINQRIKLKQKTCPRDKFILELEDILETMPYGVTYHTTTHARLLKKIEKFQCVINGEVEMTQLPYTCKGNLCKQERKLWGKCCNTCAEEKCRSRNAHINKKLKEKVEFYAVEFRRIK